MLTAEKLFSDIEKFSSGISGVRVATELDNISHPLQKPPSDMLLTERPTSIAETIEKASTRDSLSQTDDSKLHKLSANVIGSIANRSRSTPSYDSFTPGHLEKRVSKFAHQSAFWFRNGFKRLRKRKHDAKDHSLEDDSNRDALIVRPYAEVDTVADRTSSATNESK